MEQADDDAETGITIRLADSRHLRTERRCRRRIPVRVRERPRGAVEARALAVARQRAATQDHVRAFAPRRPDGVAAVGPEAVQLPALLEALARLRRLLPVRAVHLVDLRRP